MLMSLLLRSSPGRVVALLDDQLQRTAVRPRDCGVDLPAFGHGDPEAGAERKAEVVGGREIRRVGNCEEERAVLENAQRQRFVATSQLLRQQGDCLPVELGDVEVDVLELVLLGQRARDRPLGREAEGHRDLTEALPR